MGRRGLAGSIAVLALAVPVPASGASKRCAAPDGVVAVKGSASAVVFERQLPAPSAVTRMASWGCLKSRGRLWRLPDDRVSDTSDQSVKTRLRLSGRFLAWTSATTYRGFGGASVQVLDLRSGRRTGTDAGYDTPGGPQDAARVAGLALTPTGAVAWLRWDLVHDGAGGWRPIASIVARDRGGVRLLDTGPRADVARLRSSGSTVTWSSRGEPRSARLR